MLRLHMRCHHKIGAAEVRCQRPRLRRSCSKRRKLLHMLLYLLLLLKLLLPNLLWLP